MTRRPTKLTGYRLVGDPSGYKIRFECDDALPDELHLVFFVAANGFVDKTCFNNFEKAEKRMKYYRYGRGGLGKGFEVAESTLAEWKKLSGYNQAQNLNLELDRLATEKKIAQRKKTKWHSQTQFSPVCPEGHKRLYVIECNYSEFEDDPHFVKVGVSAQPQKRLGIMQTGCPFELKLFCETESNPNTSALEKFLHDKMQQLCERGEWFNLHSNQLKKFECFLRDSRLFGSVPENWNKIWVDYDVLSNRNWLIYNSAMLYGEGR